MLAKTHIAVGLLFGLIFIQFVQVDSLLKFFLYFGLVIFGALLPDIDHPSSTINKKIKISKILTFILKHRGITHSIFMPLILLGLLWHFLGIFYGISLFIGYIAHLFADAVTLEGICFLHPLSNFKIRGILRTGRFIEKIVFWTTIVLILVRLYYFISV